MTFCVCTIQHFWYLWALGFGNPLVEFSPRLEMDPNASLPLLSSKTYFPGFLFIFVALGCMLHIFLVKRCLKQDKVLQVRLFQPQAALLHVPYTEILWIYV